MITSRFFWMINGLFFEVCMFFFLYLFFCFCFVLFFFFCICLNIGGKRGFCCVYLAF